MGLDSLVTENTPDDQRANWDVVDEKIVPGALEDVEQPPAEWLQEISNKSGIPKKELLITQNSPLNSGASETALEVLRWVKNYYHHYIDEREGEKFYKRGLHYFIFSEVEEEVESPNPKTEENNRGTEWRYYDNTSACASWLNRWVKEATKVIDPETGEVFIPEEKVLDRKNDDPIRITKYRSHSPPNDWWYSDPIDIPEFASPSHVTCEFSTVDEYKELLLERAEQKVRDGLRISESALQPYHIELWCEKTLPDEIHQVANNISVNVIQEGEGFASEPMAREFIQRVNDAGKPAILFYLTDFDPSGKYMPGALAEKDIWKRLSGDIEYEVIIERIGITKQQILDHELPPKPAGDSNLDRKWKAQRQFDRVVEINALEANMQTYKDIIRQIEAHLDQELPDKISEAKKDYVERIVDRFEDHLNDQDELEGKIERLQEWIDEHNDLIDDGQEVIQQIRDHEKDDKYTDWKNSGIELWNELEKPTPNPPEGVANPPEDPLYRSSWAYSEILETVERHRTK